jgi:threonyl-tRNA synthetase
MAAAVGQMFPEAQFGVGPVIENGCYYDFVLPRTLIPEDLPLLEKKIKEMLKQPLVFKVQEMELLEVISLFEKMNQPLKVELLQDLATRGTTSMSEEERADFEIVASNNLNNSILKIHTAFTNFNKKPEDKSNFEILIQQFDSNILNLHILKDKYMNILNSIKQIQKYNSNNYSVSKINDNDADLKYGKHAVKYSNLVEFSNFIIEWAKENNNDHSKLIKGLSPKITIYRLENEKTGEDLFVDLCKGPHVESVKEFNLIKEEGKIKTESSLNKLGKVVEAVSSPSGFYPGVLAAEILKNTPSKTTTHNKTSSLGFKLDKFSGSYWRGDQDRNIQMQRIYALVFETKEELKDFEEKRKLAQERDHRKLGQELEIFMVSDEVGSGLPLYLPNGAAIRQLLEKYCYQEAKKSGYQYVYTPHIGKEDLFKKSGHLDHYRDGMFAPIDMVNLDGEGVDEGGKVEKFYLKPMNCPMHHNIYLNTPKSYRDLPYRLYEYGTVYRYEESGTLSGMIRVRGFTQNDAHVYCQRTQLKEVIGEALNRFIKAYNDIGITDYKMRFSLPDFVNDKEKFGEETVEWVEAVSAMRQALDELGVDYYDAVGEAAFYGPKIDIQVKNVNGKEDSLSTIQVDYSIAPKFGITYKNDKGEEEVPAIIHMALMGSVDRFMAFMLEMTGGRLPLWLAPTQVKILTINNESETMNYVAKIKQILDETVLMKPLKYNELRFELDDRNESLGKKIREATNQKIPVMLIVGPKDIAENQVSVRTQEGEEKVKLEGLKEFLQQIK